MSVRMTILPRVERIARQFSTVSKAASKLTASARKPEARNMATAADSKMEFQRSTYYVGDTPGWTNEWYKENDSPSAILDKFEVAIASNRASAASSWKSAVRLMRASRSQYRDSYCYSAESSKQFMEPAILYRPASESFESSPGPSTPNSACPCITGVTCICSFKSE